jgi:hypothetical protein
VKARKVKGLDPDGTLADNARRIVLVRLDELYTLAAAALDPADKKALHDTRIAAKRLRYVLEITEPCFGKTAQRGAKTARGLQDILGEIHDCDEMLPRVREHAERLRAEDAAVVRDAREPESEDLDPGAARAAPNRTRYRGLEALTTYLLARRDVLFANFLVEWARMEDDGFREKLESELAAPARYDGSGRAAARRELRQAR